MLGSHGRGGLRGELIEFAGGDALVDTDRDFLRDDNLRVLVRGDVGTRERLCDGKRGCRARVGGYRGRGHSRGSTRGRIQRGWDAVRVVGAVTRALAHPFPRPVRVRDGRKLSRFQRSAYRVAELLVETVRQLADARGDLIEVHGLLSPVALHDVHGHFVLVAPSP